MWTNIVISQCITSQHCNFVLPFELVYLFCQSSFTYFHFDFYLEMTVIIVIAVGVIVSLAFLTIGIVCILQR